MSALAIPVPPNGAGDPVDVSTLLGPKTVIFVGESDDDSVYLEVSFNGEDWVKLTQLTNKAIETRDDAFVFVRAYRASGSGSCDLRIDKVGAPAGAPGAAATVAVGTTVTLAAGSSAIVANVGTPNAAILNFGIPAGPSGSPGSPGSPGAAATITVGTTNTLAPGASAVVANAGTPSAAIFNFGIPAGQNGTNAAVIKTGPTSSTLDQTVTATTETPLASFSGTPTGTKLRVVVQINAGLGNNTNVTFRLKQGATLLDVFSTHGHSGTPLGGAKLIGYATGLTAGVSASFQITGQINTGSMTIFPVSLPNDNVLKWTVEDIQ